MQRSANHASSNRLPSLRAPSEPALHDLGSWTLAERPSMVAVMNPPRPLCAVHLTPPNLRSNYVRCFVEVRCQGHNLADRLMRVYRR